MSRPNGHRRIALSLSFACLALAACSPKAGDGMQGKWAVDLDKTLAKASAAGMPAQATPRIREAYEGGLMEVTADTLVFTITGIEGNTTWKYKQVGESAGCHDLLVESRDKVTYCVKGDELEVKDPSTPLIVVYRRR